MRRSIPQKSDAKIVMTVVEKTPKSRLINLFKCRQKGGFEGTEKTKNVVVLRKVLSCLRKQKKPVKTY